MGFILKMEKGAIFVDGGYFNKVLKKYFDDQRVSYSKLGDEISNQCSFNRLRTYFYHCLPIVRNDNQQDILKKSGMQKFLTNLKRLPRFEIKLGKLQLIGNQFKQKMIDVLMSLDITNMAYEKQVQHIVLVAGDADFVPAIKKAKDYGAITHLFYHPSSAHNEILDEIDELHELNLNFINSCKIK